MSLIFCQMLGHVFMFFYIAVSCELMRSQRYLTRNYMQNSVTSNSLQYNSIEGFKIQNNESLSTYSHNFGISFSPAGLLTPFHLGFFRFFH